MKHPFFLLMLLLAAACEPPPSGQQAPVSGLSTGNPQADQLVEGLIEGVSNLSVEFEEMAKPNKVQAWVDKLIVKGQPGTNMPQVATMKEGEIATYLKQRTVRKSEFTLRGQRYYEPWLLIRTKDSIMGWVHEGGVRYVEEDLLSLLSGGQGGGAGATQRTRGMDSSQEPAAVSETRDFLIVPGQRIGPMKLTTSEEALIRLYGPGNVGRSTVRTTGTNTETCTVLMAGTNNELRITWKDETHARIKAIYLDKPNSSWLSAQGLRVGMGLMDLTKANKSPISFYGFNWEYGGTVSSYRNGVLGKYEKYFYAVLLPRNSQQAAGSLRNFQGDQIFSSNKEGIEQLDLVVSRLVIYLD
jgi:hypothetical protein